MSAQDAYALEVQRPSSYAEPVYASWGARVGAALIDGFCAFIVIMIGAAIGGALNSPALAVTLAIGGYMATT